MKVKTLALQNIKSYAESGLLDFSPTVNLFVGKNNSGKSVILRSIHRLQDKTALDPNPRRVSSQRGRIEYGLTDITDYGKYPQIFRNSQWPDSFVIFCEVTAAMQSLRSPNLGGAPDSMPRREPDNTIYPFLSKRNVLAFSEIVNEIAAYEVTSDFTTLPAVVDQLRDTAHPSHARFNSACIDILGFPISTFASSGGKSMGLTVDLQTRIRIESMGSGVTHILGLVARLCSAENKIFIIEEPENDLHPQALKKLMSLITESSISNQFFISTHSNIVTRYLGASDLAQIFKIEIELNGGIPTSTVTPVGTEISDRQNLLIELGYDLFDFEIYDAWLFLEESSAERIIREYLIPWFAPRLQGRLKTIAAGGIDKVEPQFADFNRLFLFTHLEEIYRNKSWVLVDGDEIGRKTIERLVEVYCPKWDIKQFRQFTKSDFEHYYPYRFKNEIDVVLSIDRSQKAQRRQAKIELGGDVRKWIDENTEDARAALAESASEVIEVLKKIESTLYG